MLTRYLPTLACAAALLSTGTSHGHFIWLLPETQGEQTIVQVYFAEDASPDDPALLNRLQGLEVWQLSGRSEPQKLATERRDDSLIAAPRDGAAGSLFVATHDLGVFDRGDSKFRLLYYAKTGPQAGHAAWAQVKTLDRLKLDVVPTVRGNQLHVVVKFDGKPAAGAQVNVGSPKNDHELNADANGKAVAPLDESGVYSIRARHVENVAGELDGKSYPETRHYCTVAMHIDASNANPNADTLAALEHPVTSFGGAVLDGALYIYGGHTGGAHSYSNEEQGHVLKRLKLDGSAGWEAVAEGPGLQGLALVAHGGKLYRLGGFTAKNAEGEDQDLWSQDDVAVIDPKSATWKELPPLPEPRSSFDAAVLGDAIYVIGGWQLQGEDDSIWHQTAWKLNLAGNPPKWEALPSPPFQRRALAVAAHNGKLYAIGGMQQEGGPTRATSVFDPASGKWSEGPELIGDQGMTGFGASAFATGGRLYVSTIDGKLQRLSEDGSHWEAVRDLPTARFFHRMLPVDDHRFVVVGGASMETGKFDEVEVIDVR